MPASSCTMACALAQSPFAAHHSAASGAEISGAGALPARLDLKSTIIVGKARSAGKRLNMPLARIFQQRPVARDEAIAVFARRRGENPVGGIAWRCPGQK